MTSQNKSIINMLASLRLFPDNSVEYTIKQEKWSVSYENSKQLINNLATTNENNSTSLNM